MIPTNIMQSNNITSMKYMIRCGWSGSTSLPPLLSFKLRQAFRSQPQPLLILFLFFTDASSFSSFCLFSILMSGFLIDLYLRLHAITKLHIFHPAFKLIFVFISPEPSCFLEKQRWDGTST